MPFHPPGFDAGNPYATPQAGAFRPPPSATHGFPVFAKVMFIFDLAVSGLRALLVPLSVIGYRELVKTRDPMAPTAVAEIVFGAILVLLGATTNVCLLLRKPWAVVLGYLLLLATCGSLIVSFWQLSFQWKGFPPGSPERIGVVIGAGFTLCVRFGLMAAYFAALRQFATWAMRPAEGVVLPADYQE